MAQITLSDKIDQYASKGLTLLDKLEGEDLDVRDVFALLRKGLKNSFYALMINHVRDSARQNDVELELHSGYVEIMKALQGTFPEEKIKRKAAAYVLSVYNLSDDTERENIKDGLFDDLFHGVPYSGNILVAIFDFEYKNSGKINYE